MKPIEFFVLRRESAGGLIGAIMSINTEKEVRDFYVGYVAWLMAAPAADVEFPASSEFARRDVMTRIARENIGWCFGECMSQESIALWARVTGARHPVFGTNLPKTVEEAYEAGRRKAESMT